MKRVLFVCLGNICRSPMAEAILKQKVNERGIKNIYIDSCGTASYHVGEAPDERTLKILKKYNILTSHIGRQFKPEDLKEFTHILVMDDANLKAVLHMAAKYPTTASIEKIRKYDANASGMDVADPWYGDITDFENCYQQLDECCENWLKIHI